MASASLKMLSELGADESEAAFDAALKKVAKAPPPKPDKDKAKPR